MKTVRILFDHCVPKPLRRELPGYEIKTAREMGWESLKNGALLESAQAAGFDVLLTVDQNLRYQQNLKDRSLTVIVMVTPGITVEDLRPLILSLKEALSSIRPGQLMEVTLPPTP